MGDKLISAKPILVLSGTDREEDAKNDRCALEQQLREFYPSHLIADENGDVHQDLDLASELRALRREVLEFKKIIQSRH